MEAPSNNGWPSSHDTSDHQGPLQTGDLNGSGTAVNALSEALKRLTFAVSTAIFSKDFENPVILDNLVASFCHKCDSRQPTTFTRERYLQNVKEWAIRFPYWKGSVMNVEVLELNEVRGYAEVLSLQHVNGLQGPDSSVQCSTVWKWRLTSGKLVSGKWKAIASYSAHHPLPDDFPLIPEAEEDSGHQPELPTTEASIALQM